MSRQSDREHAQEWARQMLADDTALILDTETTGLGGSAEVCQIAIITASTGQELFNSLVCPVNPPEYEASRIHRLTMHQLKDAPRFAEIIPQLRELLSGRRVLVYNAAFDTRILEQSALLVGITIEIPVFAAEYEDVMAPYSAYVGQWNYKYGNYRWQPLPGGDHSAVGDCQACRRVLQRMAGVADG